jgi:hypothetical protein
MLASAAAAALAALAVTVAAPAIGDDRQPDAEEFVTCLRTNGLEEAPAAASAVKPWLNERLERGDTTAQRAIDACAPDGADVAPAPVAAAEREMRECLVRHGAQLDGTDRAAVKRWVRGHAGEPEVREALKACAIVKPGVPAAGSCDKAVAPAEAAKPTDDLPAPAEKGATPRSIGT